MAAAGPPPLPPPTTTWFRRMRWRILGRPRDPTDRTLLQHMALIPILAWIGLGADALSSSAYGPEESFIDIPSGAPTWPWAWRSPPP